MYAYMQDVPISEEIHARIIERMGPEPLAGLVVHAVLANPDGTLRYFDVWESREACNRAFDERIHPAVHATFQETGFRPAGEPLRNEVPVVDVLLCGAAPTSATRS